MIAGTLRLMAWDVEGRVFHDETSPLRSPVRPLMRILLSRMTNQDVVETDTSGNAQTLDADNAATNSMRAAGLGTVDTNGIIIGTGSTVVDITNTKLVTPIAHGVGAGQMVYQAETFDANVTVADPNCTFQMSRNFNNNSGAGITVAETGIYMTFRETGGGDRNFCAFRDVPTSVAVPNGGGCRVIYTLQISE